MARGVRFRADFRRRPCGSLPSTAEMPIRHGVSWRCLRSTMAFAHAGRRDRRRRPADGARLGAALIEKGPTICVDNIVRFRLVVLVQWEEFRISVSRQTLGRELRAMGYRKLAARPRHHAQVAAGPARDRRIEIWFRDETRVREKTKTTRRWAKHGTRPSAPFDQRTRSALSLERSARSAGRCVARHSALRHARDDAASSGDLQGCHAGWPCHPHLRSGRMARVRQAVCSRQHYPRAVAAETRLSSTPSRTSGSTCAITGSLTASSKPTTTSSPTAATHGESSSISFGTS